jgi:hypothetical protein
MSLVQAETYNGSKRYRRLGTFDKSSGATKQTEIFVFIYGVIESKHVHVMHV